MMQLNFFVLCFFALFSAHAGDCDDLFQEWHQAQIQVRSDYLDGKISRAVYEHRLKSLKEIQEKLEGAGVSIPAPNQSETIQASLQPKQESKIIETNPILQGVEFLVDTVTTRTTPHGASLAAGSDKEYMFHSPLGHYINIGSRDSTDLQLVTHDGRDDVVHIDWLPEKNAMLRVFKVGWNWNRIYIHDPSNMDKTLYELKGVDFFTKLYPENWIFDEEVLNTLRFRLTHDPKLVVFRSYHPALPYVGVLNLETGKSRIIEGQGQNIFLNSDRRFIVKAEVGAGTSNQFKQLDFRIWDVGKISESQLFSVAMEDISPLRLDIVSAAHYDESQRHIYFLLSDGQFYDFDLDSGTVEAIVSKTFGVIDDGIFVGPSNVEFSPDGRIVAFATQKKIYVLELDVGSYQEVVKLENDQLVDRLMFSANGKSLFVAYSETDPMLEKHLHVDIYRLIFSGDSGSEIIE